MATNSEIKRALASLQPRRRPRLEVFTKHTDGRFTDYAGDEVDEGDVYRALATHSALVIEIVNPLPR